MAAWTGGGAGGGPPSGRSWSWPCAGWGVATGGALTQVMPRRFTAARQRAIPVLEIGRRWRTLPEATISPAAVAYQPPGAGPGRGPRPDPDGPALGVGAPEGCGRGATRPRPQILTAYGWPHHRAAATYADSTGSMLVTVGVAVLPSSAAATSAGNRLADWGSRRRPTARWRRAGAPDGGSRASRGSQRQLSWATHAGSYVIMATAGYADGQPQEHVVADSYLFAEMSNLELGIGDTVSGVLGKAPVRHGLPGAPGC